MPIIVEIVGKGIRSIPNYKETRAELTKKRRLSRLKDVLIGGPVQASVEMESTNTKAGGQTDSRCWKNKRYARKIWMRHPHRTVYQWKEVM